MKTATRLAHLAVTASLLAGLFGAPAWGQTLRGSRASIDRQNRQARQHDFTFLQRRAQLERFVDAGLLVPLDDGEHYRLHDVSFNATRPEVKLFIERLSAQYLEACGERLVVTSLTRPTSLQPANASPRSVHPTGMAVDLRVPAGSCRRWLESTLLSLERRRVLDATLERAPLHFHVAVFPNEYLAYVAGLTGRPESALLASVQRSVRHTVRRSETLSAIAERYGTTVARLKAANGLTSDLIRPGQTLEIPGTL
jgi:nucleoid-associated protein YgaU